MAERDSPGAAFESQPHATGVAAGQQAGGDHHGAVADALLQRMMVERAPGWNGVDPVAPGNEVWTHRPQGYNHAGVYLGNGWVVHLDGSPMIHLGRILTHGHSWATVIKTSVASFAEGGTVKPGPTIATHSANQVIADALWWVGKTRDYNPLDNNCQHFSSLLVTGTAVSVEAAAIYMLAKAALKVTKDPFF